MIMKRLFGAKIPAEPAIDPDKALQRLKAQAQERESDAQDKLAMARSLYNAKDLNKARIVMTQHQKVKAEAESLRRNIAMLEQQRSTLRDIEAKKTVVDVMKVQNDTMKTAVSTLNMNQVDTIADDMDELLDEVMDVSHALDERFDSLLPEASDTTDDSLFAIFEEEDVQRISSQLDHVRIPASAPARAIVTAVSAPVAVPAKPSYNEDWM